MELDKRLHLLNEAKDIKVGKISKKIKEKLLNIKNEIFRISNENFRIVQDKLNQLVT